MRLSRTQSHTLACALPFVIFHELKSHRLWTRRRLCIGRWAKHFHQEFVAMAKGNNSQKNEKKSMKAKKGGKKTATKTPGKK
jgi:hypothetical protein